LYIAPTAKSWRDTSSDSDEDVPWATTKEKYLKGLMHGKGPCIFPPTIIYITKVKGNRRFTRCAREAPITFHFGYLVIGQLESTN